MIWIQDRAGLAGESDYTSRLLTTSKANPLQQLAFEVEYFCNGGFAVANSGALD